VVTQAPSAASQPYSPPTLGDQSDDDNSGRRHRRVIGYLGLALPVLLVLLVRVRPNARSDHWSGDSISAYYWTGAVSLFVGLLASLSIFLLTYRGYDNASYKYDRAAATIAGFAAAVVAIFPTAPPRGIARLPWWGNWISTTHTVAAIILFSMFAVFCFWLFRKTGDFPTPADKKQRNAIYLVCGSGIVASMVWAIVARMSGHPIFWPESLAIGFFSWSWLVKGQAVSSIKSKLDAAKQQVVSTSTATVPPRV